MAFNPLDYIDVNKSETPKGYQAANFYKKPTANGATDITPQVIPQDNSGATGGAVKNLLGLFGSAISQTVKINPVSKLAAKIPALQQPKPNVTGTSSAKFLLDNSSSYFDKLTTALSKTKLIKSTIGLGAGKEQEQQLAETTKSFYRGTAGTADMFLSSPLDFVSHAVYGKDSEMGSFIHDFTTEIQKRFTTEQSEAVERTPFGVEKLKDPHYWTTTIPEQIPQTLAFAAVGTALAPVKGAGLIRSLLQYGAAGAASRVFESIAEAEDGYRTAINESMPRDAALKAEAEIFKKNMTLAGLNSAQLAAAILPFRLGTGGSFLTKLLGEITGLAFNVISEGGEEVYQYKIQQEALGKEFSLSDPQARESGFIGALMGGLFHVAGRVSERQAKKIQTEYMDNLVSFIPEDKRGGYPQAKTFEQKIKALNAISQFNPQVMNSAVQSLEQETQQAAQGAKEAVTAITDLPTQEEIREELQTKSVEQLVVEIGQKIGYDEASVLVRKVAEEAPTVPIAPTVPAPVSARDIPKLEKPVDQRAIKEVSVDLDKINEDLEKKTPSDLQDAFDQHIDAFESSVKELRADIAALKQTVEQAKPQSEEKKQGKINLAKKMSLLTARENRFNKQLEVYSKDIRDFIGVYTAKRYPHISEATRNDALESVYDDITNTSGFEVYGNMLIQDMIATALGESIPQEAAKSVPARKPKITKEEAAKALAEKIKEEAKPAEKKQEVKKPAKKTKPSKTAWKRIMKGERAIKLDVSWGNELFQTKAEVPAILADVEFGTNKTTFESLVEGEREAVKEIGTAHDGTQIVFEVEGKNVPFNAEIVRALRTLHPDAELVVVGSGSYQKLAFVEGGEVQAVVVRMLGDIGDIALTETEAEKTKAKKETLPIASSIKEAEIIKVSNNLLQNNPGITRRDAEAMARDIIENRKFNNKAVSTQKAKKTAEAIKQAQKPTTVTEKLPQQAVSRAKTLLMQRGIAEGTSERIAGMIDRVAEKSKDVSEKDIQFIADTVNHSTRAVFKEITGIKLVPTQKGASKQIRKYIGAGTMKPKEPADFEIKTKERTEDDIAASIKTAKAEGKSFDEWVKGRGGIKGIEKYKTANELTNSVIKEPLEAGIDSKNLAGAYKIGDTNSYILAKKTGKTVNERISIVDTGGKEISSRIDKVPEIEYRIAQFDENIDNNLYNSYLRAKTGYTKLGDVKKKLVEDFKTRSRLKAEWDAVSVKRDEIKAKIKKDFTTREASISFIKEVRDRLHIDFDVYLAQTILVDAHQKAEGITAGNAIVLALDAVEHTDRHEVVHLVLENIKDIPVFARNGLTKENILQAQAREMGVELTKDTAASLEETLAENFELYRKNQTVARAPIAKGIVRKFFSLLKAQLAKLKRMLTDHKDAVGDFYAILDHGKARAEEITRVENKGIVHTFLMYDGTLYARGAFAAKEVNTEQSISKAKAAGQSFDEWVKGQTEPPKIQTDTVNGNNIVTLYHGTSKSNAERIRKDGVIRLGGEDSDIPNKVFLTSHPDRAKEFGSELIEVKLRYGDKNLTDIDGTDLVYSKDIKLPPTRSQLKAEWDGITSMAGNAGTITPSKLKAKSERDARAAWREAKEIEENYKEFQKKQVYDGLRKMLKDREFFADAEHAIEAMGIVDAIEKGKETREDLQSGMELMGVFGRKIVEIKYKLRGENQKLKREYNKAIAMQKDLDRQIEDERATLQNTDLMESTDALRDFIARHVSADIERENLSQTQTLLESAISRKQMRSVRDNIARRLRRHRAVINAVKKEEMPVFTLLEETRPQQFRRKIQDINTRIEVAQQQMLEQGAVMEESGDVFLHKTLLPRKIGGTLDLFERTIKEPFIANLVTDEVSLEEFDLYAHALYASQGNKIAKERGFKGEDGSGMSNERASEVLNEFEASGKIDLLKKHRQKLREIQEMILAMQVEYGLRSEEEVAVIRDIFGEDYVPLGRELEAVESGIGKGKEGVDVRGKESKRFKGSKKQVLPITAQVFSQFERAVKRVEENRVFASLLDFIEQNSENPSINDLFTVTKQRYKPVYNNKGELRYLDPVMMAKPNVIGGKVNGLQVYIEIHDELYARAMKETGKTHGIAVTRAILRFMAATITQYAPGFILRNLQRDFLEGMINIQEIRELELNEDQRNKLSRNITKNMPSLIRGIFRHENGKETPHEKLIERFKSAGGEVGYYWSKDITALADDLQKLEAQYKNEGFEKIKNKARAAGKFTETLNVAVELGIRLSIFDQLTQRGISNKKAAQIAGDITVDFNKVGEWGGFLKSIYLFINPQIQGTKRVYTALYRSKRVRVFAGGMFVAGFINGLLSMLIGGDGDDDIPDYQKNTRVVFATPNGHKLTLFYLPYGYNTFYASGRHTAEMAMGKKNISETMTASLLAALDSFQPFGGSRFSLTELTPSFAKPLFEIQFNQAWWGGLIKPDQPAYQAKIPDSSLYWDSVSEFSKFTTKQLNTFTGGNERKSGWIDISPESLDYAIAQYSGGVGKFIRDTLETTGAILTGKELRTEHIPFVQDYYTAIDTVRAKKNTIYPMLDDSARKEFNEKKSEKYIDAVDLLVEKGEYDAVFGNKLKNDFIENQHFLKTGESRLDTAIQDNVGRLENESVKKVSSDIGIGLYASPTDSQLNTIRKSLKIWQTFGKDERVDEIMDADTNEYRAKLLIEYKAEMGNDAFAKFLKNGRKEYTTVSGGSGNILISDDLLKKYKKLLAD